MSFLVVKLGPLTHVCRSFERVAGETTCVFVAEVYTNEGGVTKTVGGMQCLILPAGYLGSCVWGAVFTLLASVNVWSLRVSAALLLLMLLVVAGFYAGNCTIVCVSLLFVTEVTAAWVCTELFHTVWPLRVAMLSIGATNAVYGLLDIIDDTVKRKVPESDAYKCARLTMCSSRLCGLLWSLFALLFMTTTCYFLLAVKAVGDESI